MDKTKILCVADGGITTEMMEDFRRLERYGAEVTIVEDTDMYAMGPITDRMTLIEQQGIDAAPAAVDRGGVDPGALGDLGDGDRPGTALLQQLNNGVQHRSAHAPGTAAGAQSHGAHGAHGTGRATLPRLFTAARLHDISLGQRLASTTDRTLQS